MYLMAKTPCWKCLKKWAGWHLYWLAKGNEKHRVSLQAIGRVLRHPGPHLCFEYWFLKEISVCYCTVCTKLILWEYIWFWSQNTEYIIQVSTAFPSEQACLSRRRWVLHPTHNGMLSSGSACTSVRALGWRGHVGLQWLLRSCFPCRQDCRGWSHVRIHRAGRGCGQYGEDGGILLWKGYLLRTCAHRNTMKQAARGIPCLVPCFEGQEALSESV